MSSPVFRSGSTSSSTSGSTSKTRPLRILKFGGTSVGDGACIRQVAEIVRQAAGHSDLVVVVSAMSGVTNKLIEAATRSEAGDRASAAAIFDDIRKQHEAAMNRLIHSAEQRRNLTHKMQQCYEEGERLSQGTSLLRELTLRTRDSISSLGERLSAPLVAAALLESGVPSAAIDASEIIVTDSNHGAAEPCIQSTRERSQARLVAMLKQGIVPVVTGFIGATSEGVLTTLGRGGSDYSATILGAALDADEVIIWTDVDGLMTADPRLVESARTIPEISYREAAELAHFGAKVLHPKTLRAVTQCGIPLWIRNTFAPERPGTRITPSGPGDAGVKGLAAIHDVTLVTVGGPGMAGVPDVLGRTLAATAAVRANVLLLSQSSAQNDLCLIVPSGTAKPSVEALRHEFAHDAVPENGDSIKSDSAVAIVTVVGKNMLRSGIAERTFAALGREQVGIVAIAQGSSDCNLSFVVAERAVTAALVALHREFQLGAVPADGLSSNELSADDLRSDELPSDDPSVGSTPYYDSERPIATGD